MQEVQHYKPSTVSRRLSIIVVGCYRTWVIDNILEHSPAHSVRRPHLPPESPTLGPSTCSSKRWFANTAGTRMRTSEQEALDILLGKPLLFANLVTHHSPASRRLTQRRAPPHVPRPAATVRYAAVPLVCRTERPTLGDMVSFIKSVTFDCQEPLLVATLWARALGSNVDEDSTQQRAWVEAPGWGGPSLWFVRVPETKSAKNRQHFDLRPTGSRTDEVSRLISLGAAVVRDDGHLTVMIDPEGNEFCVE